MPVVGSVMERIGVVEWMDGLWQAEADRTPRARRSTRIREEKWDIEIIQQ